ncbi:hypothetical protein CAOG_06508 [Capsaspora owczarzaki ATCC 30864]|uniref:BZIP domain-containing protein n=1 Tax=Capsaspora owczarzaki (strain ATCC 30864) TaxID=595528 RepID=A0A0D2WVF5_CAPO3|nr:hypothetical protein CAOG_06508 [Capsaspora owczarzaki ATCC 30864]KJE96143.1 hypothetical protein CAOG_006508 [Capsaspora owczarzaki ATCC 30864]|eukprot:XP_004345257.1 hypothetical protein CAOG_06508 [Capsaspora owczarzaki ATCC 30864]
MSSPLASAVAQLASTTSTTPTDASTATLASHASSSSSSSAMAVSESAGTAATTGTAGTAGAAGTGMAEQRELELSLITALLSASPSVRRFSNASGSMIIEEATSPTASDAKPQPRASSAGATAPAAAAATSSPPPPTSTTTAAASTAGVGEDADAPPAKPILPPWSNVPRVPVPPRSATVVAVSMKAAAGQVPATVREALSAQQQALLDQAQQHDANSQSSANANSTSNHAQTGLQEMQLQRHGVDTNVAMAMDASSLAPQVDHFENKPFDQILGAMRTTGTLVAQPPPAFNETSSIVAATASSSIHMADPMHPASGTADNLSGGENDDDGGPHALLQSASLLEQQASDATQQNRARAASTTFRTNVKRKQKLIDMEETTRSLSARCLSMHDELLQLQHEVGVLQQRVAAARLQWKQPEQPLQMPLQPLLHPQLQPSSGGASTVAAAAAMFAAQQQFVLPPSQADAMRKLTELAQQQQQQQQQQQPPAIPQPPPTDMLEWFKLFQQQPR